MATRLRHLHLPDSPPHYPPFWLANYIEKFTRKQMVQGLNGDKKRFAAPPPTVISFTPHPTYSIYGADRHDSDIAAIEEPLRLKFPRLMGNIKPRSNFGVQRDQYNEQGDNPDFVMEGDPFDHTYKPDVMNLSHRQMPPYHGPGRLVLWPVLDLPSLGRGLANPFLTKLGYLGLLADTTIAMLRREFDIRAFSNPDKTGLFVKSGQIGAIWPKIGSDGITSCGMTLNVGDPAIDGQAPEPDGASDAERDFSQASSIAVELSSILALPPRKNSILNIQPARSLGLVGTGGTQWYTRSYDGRVSSAPLGMDNYTLAISWTYELAHQLGIRIVDHKGTHKWQSRDLGRSGKFAQVPARPRIYTQSVDEHEKTVSRARGEDVPDMPTRPVPGQGRVPSWQITQWRLLRDLEQSVLGRKLDTRKDDHLILPETGDNSWMSRLSRISTERGDLIRDRDRSTSQPVEERVRIIKKKKASKKPAEAKSIQAHQGLTFSQVSTYSGERSRPQG